MPEQDTAGRRSRRQVLKIGGAAFMGTGVAGPVHAKQGRATPESADDDSYVFAEYNIERLNTDQVQYGGDEQLSAAAEVVQRQPEPDVLLVCELDNNFQEGKAKHTHNGEAFLEKYLNVPQGPGLSGVDFEYFYAPESNTGVPSGIDQFKDGHRIEQSEEFPAADDYANDCWGYGEYPGHFAMGIYSKYPIDFDNIRTLRRLLWRDIPADKIPKAEDREADWTGWLTPAERDRFRVSSKTHADVPIEIGDETVHAFITHPTPPGFDGPENMNGRRCYAENKLVADYVRGDDYIYDDDGVEGGLDEDDKFVIMGDLNTEAGAEVTFDVIGEHVFNERVNTDNLPTSEGGRAAGNEFWTAGFEKQADYILPSTDFAVEDSAVFWPSEDEEPELNKLARNASDHFMIWSELELED